MAVDTREQQIQDHPIWDQMEALHTLIQEVQSQEAVSDPESILNLERLESIARYIDRVFDRVEPTLIPLQLLADINQQLQSVVSNLTTFQSNRSARHLEAALGSADDLLLQIARVPTVVTEEDVASIRESVSSLRKSVSQHVHNMNVEADQVRSAQNGLEARAHELASEIEQQKGRLDTAISQTQEQTTKQLGEFQEQFSNAQEQRLNEHQKFRTDWQNDLEQAIRTGDERLTNKLQESQEAVSTQLSDFQAQAQNVIDELDDQLTNAKRIVNVVGNIGITGDYQRNAEEQRDAANSWRKLAYGSFIVAAVIGFALLFIFGPTEIGAIEIVRRTALSVLLSGAALYAMSQSNLHRVREQEYRSKELELASLEPFIALLDEDVQKAVKESLVSRYFTGSGQPLEAITVHKTN